MVMCVYIYIYIWILVINIFIILNEILKLYLNFVILLSFNCWGTLKYS